MPLSLPSLCLGADVFGWTADAVQSTAVLDAAFETGIRFLDTSDVYAAWANDGVGGQSETIIGDWIASRGNREDIVLASKVGWLNIPFVGGIRADTIERQIDKSLERLRTDHLDLYYAHRDDGGDLAESLAAFSRLIDAGKIRAYGLSNFSGFRLQQALEICERDGITPPSALQPLYSLMERGFERDGQELAVARGLAVVPYSSLASGFLTGKYRPGTPRPDSQRAVFAGGYLDDPRGTAVLEELDRIAASYDVPVASVALAWLRSRPGVVAPIASARIPDHIGPLAASVGLSLSDEEIAGLELASRIHRTATETG
jgi:aryl-alcohol dehydrogenase-like predicted oxidoreductase